MAKMLTLRTFLCFLRHGKHNMVPLAQVVHIRMPPGVQPYLDSAANQRYRCTRCGKVIR